MRHVLEHDLNIQNVSEKSSQCILATLLAHKKRQQTCINTFYVCQGLFSYRHHIGKREDPEDKVDISTDEWLSLKHFVWPKKEKSCHHHLSNP